VNKVDVALSSRRRFALCVEEIPVKLGTRGLRYGFNVAAKIDGRVGGIPGSDPSCPAAATRLVFDARSAQWSTGDVGEMDFASQHQRGRGHV
jgi:hypothetical protein